MRTTRRNGFTIVEAIIGLVVAVLVLGGLSGLLITATSMFKRSGERIDPRESVHLALAQVSLRIADSWAYATTEAGDRLVARSARGDFELVSTPDGRLLFKEAGAARVLLTGVKAFAVREIAAGMLRLEVEVKREGAAREALGDCRIVHEVRVPAVCDRDPLLPVRPVFPQA